LKGFRFRLARVLQTRRLQERVREIALARAHHQWREAEQQARRQLQQLDSAWSGLSWNARRAVSELRAQLAWVGWCRRQWRKAEERLLDCERQMKAARAEYLSCRRRRQVLERLRERARRRYWQELWRREQREMDDITGSRWKEVSSWNR